MYNNRVASRCILHARDYYKRFFFTTCTFRAREMKSIVSSVKETIRVFDASHKRNNNKNTKTQMSHARVI